MEQGQEGVDHDTYKSNSHVAFNKQNKKTNLTTHSYHSPTSIFKKIIQRDDTH